MDSIFWLGQAKVDNVFTAGHRMKFPGGLGCKVQAHLFHLSANLLPHPAADPELWAANSR